MNRIFAVFAIGLAFSAELAFADNFRCPNGNIVSTGDRISTVATKCDPPDFTFRREEPVEIEGSSAGGAPRSKIIYNEVQEWTYNQGLLHTLIFRNGILSEISFGGFGK